MMRRKAIDESLKFGIACIIFLLIIGSILIIISVSIITIRADIYLGPTELCLDKGFDQASHVSQSLGVIHCTTEFKGEVVKEATYSYTPVLLGLGTQEVPG